MNEKTTKQAEVLDGQNKKIVENIGHCGQLTAQITELKIKLAQRQEPAAVIELSPAQKAAQQFDEIIAKRLGDFKSQSTKIY